MTQTLRIRRPDDWHLHLRDGAMLEAVLPFTARQFARAIVMPNLSPPVIRAADARAYRQRIMDALPAGMNFNPLMTAYLTDDSDADDIAAGHADGSWVAAKLYPAGATTNSASGVTDIANIRHILARMEKIGMVLCIHGEVTDGDVDIFDREAVFIERTLDPIRRDFPGLRIVLEHITTRDAVDYVRAAADPIAATITPQHIHINRNAIFKGGINPHAYCLPVAKREVHRRAVREAATSGEPRFFLGTDSAPHARDAKESACGCAGIFNAPFALETYVQAFDEDDALDNFEAFASLSGPAFYGMAPNEERISLTKSGTDVPARIEGEQQLTPFFAGQRLDWRLD